MNQIYSDLVDRSINALINFLATVNPVKKQRDRSFQFLKYNDILFETKFIEIKILEREKQIVFYHRAFQIYSTWNVPTDSIDPSSVQVINLPAEKWKNQADEEFLWDGGWCNNSDDFSPARF